MTSSNIFFCPQPENIQFTVIEKERNQKTFTFNELESEKLDFFSKKICNTSNYQNSRQFISYLTTNPSIVAALVLLLK